MKSGQKKSLVDRNKAYSIVDFKKRGCVKNYCSSRRSRRLFKRKGVSEAVISALPEMIKKYVENGGECNESE